MDKKKQVRLQIFVDELVAKRLDELAKAVGASRNDIAEWLLEMSTSDVEFYMNKLGAWLTGRLLKATGRKLKPGDLQTD